jgi:hypothetical protein
MAQLAQEMAHVAIKHRAATNADEELLELRLSMRLDAMEAAIRKVAEIHGVMVTDMAFAANGF